MDDTAQRFGDAPAFFERVKRPAEDRLLALPKVTLDFGRLRVRGDHPRDRARLGEIAFAGVERGAHFAGRIPIMFQYLRDARKHVGIFWPVTMVACALPLVAHDQGTE